MMKRGSNNMKVYLVWNLKEGAGNPEVCLNRCTAEVLARKWESFVEEVESVDDYVI